MLTSVSGTTAERISIYFYRVSFLKLQILNKALARPSRTSQSSGSGHDTSQNLRQDLQAWYEEWSREVEQFSVSEDRDQAASVTQLKAWGQLTYYETLLISSRTETVSQTTFLEKIHQVCEQFIRACTTLTRGQAASSRLVDVSENQPQPCLPYVFPMTWTTTHAVFAAGLSLFQMNTSDAAMAEVGDRKPTLRRCLTLMASLEANPNNMAAGFTDTLERLCSEDEQ